MFLFYLNCFFQFNFWHLLNEKVNPFLSLKVASISLLVESFLRKRSLDIASDTMQLCLHKLYILHDPRKEQPRQETWDTLNSENE